MINSLLATDQPYYIILGERHLYFTAALEHIQTTLYTKTELDEAFLDIAVETQKSIIWIRYDSSEENTLCTHQFSRIGNSNSCIVSFNLYGYQLPDGTRIQTSEQAAEEVPRMIVKCERVLIDHGVMEDRCGNCHSKIGENEKYCRYCGTKHGEGYFSPEITNYYECVYGPPVRMKYLCEDCKNSWYTIIMAGDNYEYCPRCGKKSTSILESRAIKYTDKYREMKEKYLREQAEQETEKKD